MATLLNWPLFERKVKEKNLLIFTPLDIRRIFGSKKGSVSSLLHRYVKRGWLRRLRQGLYVLSSVALPDVYVANQLYEPSYLSFEFALSYYQIIPETVYEITSVTPKATRRFNTLGKIFSYRHIKPEAYIGYEPASMGGVTFMIAEPEKALVDTLYFVALSKKTPIDLERIDFSRLDTKKIFAYAQLFNQDVVDMAHEIIKRVAKD